MFATLDRLLKSIKHFQSIHLINRDIWYVAVYVDINHKIPLCRRWKQRRRQHNQINRITKRLSIEIMRITWAKWMKKTRSFTIWLPPPSVLELWPGVSTTRTHTHYIVMNIECFFLYSRYSLLLHVYLYIYLFVHSSYIILFFILTLIVWSWCRCVARWICQHNLCYYYYQF